MKAEKKVKKPWYKKIWVWVLILTIMMGSCGTNNNSTENYTPSTQMEVTTPTKETPSTLLDTDLNVPEVEDSFVEKEIIITPEEEIPETTIPIVREPTIKYVLITRTGSKYHDKYCGSVDNKTDLTEMTEEEALASGYEACGRCNP